MEVAFRATNPFISAYLNLKKNLLLILFLSINFCYCQAEVTQRLELSDCALELINQKSPTIQAIFLLVIQMVMCLRIKEYVRML